jgi:hypothetical protein
MPRSGCCGPKITMWEATVRPQSKGLFWIVFAEIKLSWLEPISSLTRMPPAFFSTKIIGDRGMIHAA